MTDRIASIVRFIEQREAELIGIRRDFHRHPETLYGVDRTAARVAELLERWGIETERGVGRHFGRGVVGTLRGGRGRGPGKTVLLRADMDALPIEEENETEYRSMTAGAMHACGHDVHMAMLLGAAQALSAHREAWDGVVRFVFQPAEEGALPSPEDGVLRSGGRDLVESGVADGADYAFALHVWPELPVGALGVHRGYVMAASSHFTVAFAGRSGHHGAPQLAADALLMAVEFALAMKTFMATGIDPFEPAVLSFGTLRAGSAINTIAASGEIAGTFRAFAPETAQRIRAAIERRAAAAADAHGGTYTLRLREGAALRNDEGAAELAHRAAVRALGEAGARWLERPSLAGEDFALYLQRVPGAFAWIGVRSPDSALGGCPLHHPRFDVDERVVALGAKWFVHAVMAALPDEL